MWQNNTGTTGFKIFLVVFIVMTIMIGLGIYLKG